MIGGLILLACTASSRAVATEVPQSKAVTSRQARDEATRTVPFDKLSKTARTKALAVINDTSLFRRLPVQTIDCEPDLYRFVVEHPELVVNMWEVMGITKMTLDRVDTNRFRVVDGEGTKGTMEYLLSTPDLHIIYSEGTYDGPLYARTVRGRCLMVLRTTSQREQNGRYTITSRLDTFLAVDNLGVEILAKTFQPVIGRAADHNFSETAQFVSNLSRTAERNERGMIRMTDKLKRISPETKQGFVDVVSSVSDKLAVDDAGFPNDGRLVRAP